MEGEPAVMGDWSLVRVLYEGGRLLRKHFGDFLPIMLVFNFPACLTKVYYTQFYLQASSDFFRPRIAQGPTDPEPTPLWILLLLQLLLDLVSMFSILAGLLVIRHVVKGKIYVGCDKTERHSESFYTTVKLAFTSTEVETETSALLNGRFRKPYKAKFLEVLCALIVLNFVAIRTTEIKFTPEAIAAMGLPPWTILLFTLLMALYTTLAASYIQLVTVVGIVWSQSPQALLLV